VDIGPSAIRKYSPEKVILHPSALSKQFARHQGCLHRFSLHLEYNPTFSGARKF